jgi:hypothetical protein
MIRKNEALGVSSTPFAGEGIRGAHPKAERRCRDDRPDEIAANTRV